MIISRLPFRPWPLLWGVAGLVLAILLASLPVELSVALLGSSVLMAAAVVEPAIGLGLAIALGPAKAYLAAAVPGLPADLGQVFFALAAAGWLARGLLARSLHLPVHALWLPLGLYLAAGAVSLLAAASLEEGLKETLKWFQVGLGAVIAVAEARRGRLPWLVAAVLLAGLAQASLGLWQYFFQVEGPEHFRLGAHFRAYGSFEQPNPYGGFLGLIWPLAAGLALASTTWAWTSRAPRAVFYTAVFGSAAAFLLAGLYVSLSRGAWLGAAAAALVLAVTVSRRVLVGLGLVGLGLVLAWGLVQAGLLPASLTARLVDVADFTTFTDVRGANITPQNYAILERLAHWQAAEGMAREHPWLGVGIGNYAAAYPRYSLINWPAPLGHAHMIYLNVLAETGVIGFLTYLALWAAVIALTMQTTARATGLTRGLAVGLLGVWAHLSAHQLVDNLYVNNIHLTLAALLGLLVYLSQSTGALSTRLLHLPKSSSAYPA